jgi:hypothetical protein
MITFTTGISDLKKALSVVRLGAGEAAESIHSHALFVLKKGKVILYATDEDKIALSNFSAEYTEEKDIRFTANPKRIQELITNSDSDQIKFTYDEEEKTLNVYASEDSKSFLSFASFEPDEFLTFNKELSDRKVIKTINAEVFLNSMRFSQGYLPGDDKDKKYTNIFINEGAVYGSNGNTKIGAFKSSDLDGMETLALRKTMLSSIIAMIDKTGISNVVIKASDKFVTFSSEDNTHCFGFRKPNVDMPDLPISVKKPETIGFNIDRKIILKKLKRLSLASWESIGIKMIFEKDNLLIETITDRVSQERMPCKHISGEEKIDFILECNPFRSVLDLFKTDEIDMYIDKKKCTIYSEADILVEEEGKEPLNKPFIAVGFMTLARVTD